MVVKDWFLGLLSYLPHSSPNIERINMLCTFDNQTVSTAFDFILHCPSLRSLNCLHSIPLEIAANLSQLPKLESLVFNLIPPRRQTLDSPSPLLSFQSLTSLIIGGSPAIQFIRRTEFPVLRAISIRQDYPNSLHFTLVLLHSHCSVNLLESFTLWCHSDTGFPFHVIHPLFAFCNLTSVELNVDTLLGDDGLEAMAMAWPRLGRLLLGKSSPTFTLQGLIPLVRYCPESRTLRITLNGSGVPMPWDRRPADGYSNPWICAVALGSSPVDESDKVTAAAFLSDLFPNLRKIACGADSPYRKTWAGVEGLLEAFAAVRMQERGSMVSKGCSCVHKQC